MKRAFLLALAVSIFTASMVLAADKPEYPAAVKKELYAQDFRGKAAPALTVEKWLTPQPNEKGKIVIIDFWATWCGPCRKAIPELNEIQKKFKDDVVVIGISDEPEATITDFTKKTPMDYSLALDSKKTTSNIFKVAGIPHVVIISTDGVVRWQGFPLSAEEQLTPDIVQKIIDADPGIAERRKADAAKTKR